MKIEYAKSRYEHENAHRDKRLISGFQFES
jgi:hypothetical protein